MKELNEKRSLKYSTFPPPVNNAQAARKKSQWSSENVYKKSYFEGNSINTINFSSWKFYLPDNFY
jgi:hypothetical protein